jgi:hypothetical protein
MWNSPPLRPAKGGFLRPFGCGEFVRDFLMGSGPHGTPTIDPDVGAHQADIFSTTSRRSSSRMWKMPWPGRWRDGSRRTCRLEL